MSPGKPSPRPLDSNSPSADRSPSVLGIRVPEARTEDRGVWGTYTTDLRYPATWSRPDCPRGWLFNLCCSIKDSAGVLTIPLSRCHEDSRYSPDCSPSSNHALRGETTDSKSYYLSIYHRPLCPALNKSRCVCTRPQQCSGQLFVCSVRATSLPCGGWTLHLASSLPVRSGMYGIIERAHR